ncbi:hypothetical protein PSTT_08411 [Puccinia striiformis]|uniref:AAA protein C-terminal winged helix domain-containing protein n=1 Tax=Puccinia striiformis TaxID=27350 RepID=A0A2S4VCC1_9BASI|nr:hypothetical protein PSTT_08411 [Puccinia striiformis]
MIGINTVIIFLYTGLRELFPQRFIRVFFCCSMSTIHLITSRIRSTRALTTGPNRPRVPRSTSRLVRRNGQSDSQASYSPNSSADGQRQGSSSSSWSDGVAAQAIFGSLGGVLILGFGGYLYHTWYKYSVIKKMAVAFEPGYDPVLILDKASRRVPNKPELSRPSYKSQSDEDDSEGNDDEEMVEDIGWIARREQELIDQIIHGKLAGQYWLFTGDQPIRFNRSHIFDKSQYSSHSSSLLMRVNRSKGNRQIFADRRCDDSKPSGCLMKYCSSNSACFSLLRVKIGIAVCECSDNLEIFRLRLGKCLNFEFAEDYIGGLFSRRDPREGGPLVDIERALNKLEKVAVNYHTKNLRPLVLVFNNIHHLRQDKVHTASSYNFNNEPNHGHRRDCDVYILFGRPLAVCIIEEKRVEDVGIDVKDLTKEEAIRAMRTERKKLWGESRVADDPEIESIWNLDCDDDVMDEQKWASASFLLMQALVKNADAADAAAAAAAAASQPTPTSGGGWAGSGTTPIIPRASHIQWLDRLWYTRTDFLSQLDHENMIAIDTDYHIKPNSIVMLNVIRELCNEPEFQRRLDSVLERIGDIESLGRTRELIWKSGKDGDGVMNIKIEERRQV